jgi:O-antigen/teichoic acid export membrane protein
LAALLGPLGMRVVFGAGFEAGRWELTLLGFGVGCYLAAATCSQALLALDRGARAAVAWGASAGVFILAYALVAGQPLFRVSAAFALASAVNVALLGLTLVRARTVAS